MQLRKSVRKIAGTALLTAGLAYPACAAVCPKGIGGCTSPGRCFLFVDADGNSMCDYTGRTSSTPTNTATVQTQSVSSGTTTQGTGTSTVQSTSSGGLLDSLHLSVPLTEIVLFIVFAGILFALVKTGILGIRVRDTWPALALSSFFGLGLSLIATAVLAGDAGAGMVYALVYMAAGTVLAAYLWKKGVMTRKIVLAAAGMSTLAGFVFAAPIMPQEIGGLVNVFTGTAALSIGIIVIGAVIVLALFFGRTFCGTICPVGSLQELVYEIPVKKIVIHRTRALEAVRLVVFIATVVAAVYLVDLMEYTGLYDLFAFTLSAFLIVATGLVLFSVFIYRPICRILCPFGLIFSVFAEFSWFRLRRLPACTNCKKCEKACPTSAAGRFSSKRECYLCGRCTAACPADAISYRS